MPFELCEQCDFDAGAIARRVALAGLSGSVNVDAGRLLQESVIRPNLRTILDGFLDSLGGSEWFASIVGNNFDHTRLGKSLENYLLTLGIDFSEQQYFEDRLRIGQVHLRMGVPQSAYQCSFQILQGLLLRHIPRDEPDGHAVYDQLIQFVLAITALDMSLAAESYCTARMCGLVNSLHNERGKNEHLHRLATTDWLTDLHNHSHTRQLLLDALEQARSEHSPLCVIMADLDKFKLINDRHGHLVGDQVLKIAASRMISAARTHDEIGRYGGEEFLFVLRETDLATAAEVAERVRLRISSDAIHSSKAKIRVSLSLGIAQAREDDDVNTLIDRADAALYAAKQAGRDRVCLAMITA